MNKRETSRITSSLSSQMSESMTNMSLTALFSNSASLSYGKCIGNFMNSKVLKLSKKLQIFFTKNAFSILNHSKGNL